MSEKKYKEVIEDITEWEIWTDTGWHPVTHSMMTVKYKKYILVLENNAILECADDHIVFISGKEVFVKNLKTDDLIDTELGAVRVMTITKTDENVNMYDVTVMSDDHRYYTNGILSHNSTIFALYFCWLMIFNDNYNIGIASKSMSDAKAFMDRVQTTYENLPKWMQQGVKSWNVQSFELENGSYIEATATTKKSLRSRSFNFILLDEFAFVDQNIVEDFFKSVFPTISAGKTSKMGIISTPQGFNKFYQLYTDAKNDKNGFVPFEIGWNDVPNRDEKFKEQQIEKLGMQGWIEEFEAVFTGSSTTLIPNDILSKIVTNPPVYITEGIKIFKDPVKDKSYFLSADVSQGKGLDYSAFVILDISQHPYEVVATFKDNNISHIVYAKLIELIARKYNNAFILVELNDVGNEVANELFNEFEYENLLTTKLMGRAGQVLGQGSGTSVSRGVKTSSRTKSVGCVTLLNLFQKRLIEVNDFEIVKELSNFSVHGNSYKADPGMNDDLVMAMINFAWATSQTYFNVLTSLDLRNAFNQEREDLIEALPVYFDDNTQDIFQDELITGSSGTWF